MICKIYSTANHNETHLVGFMWVIATRVHHSERLLDVSDSFHSVCCSVAGEKNRADSSQPPREFLY